jgi:hypothetical protein
MVSAQAGVETTWNPAASERLVKLPPHMLEKAVDRDFQASPLAAAIGETGRQIRSKGQTLSELMAAVDQAEGDLKLELKHQFLAEKQAYVRLMGEGMEMRLKQAETKRSLYETLLRKARLSGTTKDPVTADLLAHQQAAKERFTSSLNDVDTKIFGSGYAPVSAYSADYATNKAAMDSLKSAIESHPMNQRPMLDGEEINREDYLRQLIAEAESEISLIAQEEQMLGYMAKLVALDAMALAESIEEANDSSGSGRTAQPSLAAAAPFFVGN